MWELLLSIFIGYFLGPLAIILFGILLIAVPVAIILKAFITLSDTWQKRKERKKLKKLLEKRLSYLP